MRLILVVALALVSGTLAGRTLARRGVTAANALTGRQSQAYAVFLGVVALGAILFGASSFDWTPTWFMLYSQEMNGDGLRALAAVALGLLLGLEWRGRHDPARRWQLLGGSAALTLATSFLLYRSLPVTGILGPPAVRDGIVLQTTSYSCAPAAIATLARFTRLDTGMTEREAARLAGTSREGTSAYAELRVLRALGLAPGYRRRLTTDSLPFLGPAILHVNEPILTTTVSHSVALLGVDTAVHTITVGNPLYGRQVKRFTELSGYWIGEAVVLGVAFPRVPPIAGQR